MLYQCSCILILLAVPFRILYLLTDNVSYGYVEDGLVSLAVPGTFLFFLFFGRIYALTGAFIVMIFEMITGDIATFGVIYVIVITAFGQGEIFSFSFPMNLINGWLVSLFSILSSIPRYDRRWQL